MKETRKEALARYVKQDKQKNAERGLVYVKLLIPAKFRAKAIALAAKLRKKHLSYEELERPE